MAFLLSPHCLVCKLVLQASHKGGLLPLTLWIWGEGCKSRAAWVICAFSLSLFLSVSLLTLLLP